ncbi:hypothetical protein Tco_0859683, partial [Tanacetum coccineum]
MTRGNHGPDVVKPKIGNNVNFEIKGQFMRELRESTFSRNKNDDAHVHVDRILDILKDGQIGCLHDQSTHGTFSRRHLSKGIVLLPRSQKQLEEIHNFKQEGDETMYHAWESTRRSHDSNSDGIAAITNKLDNLGRDMKKLKENIHGIQVGCETYLGASVNIMPFSMFKNLVLTNLKETTMLVEMADMSKKAPRGIVENVLVINKFVFHADFVIIDMKGNPHEILILDGCNEGDEIYEKDENEVPKEWWCFCDNKIREIKYEGITFCDWVRIRYGNSKIDDETRRRKYDEWTVHNYKHPGDPYGTRKGQSSRDVTTYFHQDSLVLKFDDMKVDQSLKMKVFEEWVFDSYDKGTSESGGYNKPYSRNFKKFSLEFENKIKQLADEYELRMGKKGYILQDIWNKCGQVSTSREDKGTSGNSSNHVVKLKVLRNFFR